MKRIIFIILVGLTAAAPAFGWGREGHETIAKIAENHLKPSAKKKIEKYLGGYSIVHFAKWMDDYRHTPEYKFTTTWHTAPVDASLKYNEDLLNPEKGDAIYGLEGAIKALENYKELPDSAVAVNIKYVLHLVGDMHCPAHIKYTTHNMKYYAFMPGDKKSTYVHTIWDKLAIQETRFYSATEWAQILDIVDKKTAKEIAAGSPREWLHDSAVRCEMQFDILKPDQKINQDFFNEAMPLIETQILYAGYRLAAVLNDLF